MRVLACRRSQEKPAEVDQIFVPEKLGDMLPLVDFLVIAVPLTAETKQIIDARAISLLKPSAWVISIGRPQLIDEDALVAALNEDRLAGAVLDDMQDYSEASPLWTAPRLYITPHTAGRSKRVVDHAVRSFAMNFAHRLKGEPMPHTFSLADVV
jgi:phosphoglycerate dehydrogenase-like enzyme